MYFLHMEQLCIFSIFTHEKTWNPYLAPIGSNYSFQRDGTFQDKGTEVPSLSRDKGTTGQAQNLAMARDDPVQPAKIRDGTWDGKSLFFFRAGFDFSFILNFKSVVIFACTQPKTKRPVTLEKVSQPHSARDQNRCWKLGQ